MSSSPQQPTFVGSHRVVQWHRRVLGICLALFALEIGLILIVLPWSRDWDLNGIPLHVRALAAIWMSGYFRGLLTGVGLLTIYVGIAELARYLSTAFRSKPEAG